MTFSDVLKKILDYRKQHGRDPEQVRIHPADMAELVNGVKYWPGLPKPPIVAHMAGSDWYKDASVSQGHIVLVP